MFLDTFADKFCSPKKLEEEVLQLPLSFEYWKNVLFEKCIRIFEWTGLPFEQKELEMRVLFYGFAGYIDDPLIGRMAGTISMSGVTEYWDKFTKATYAAPTAKGGTVMIGRDCCVVSNTALRNSIMPMIERYASLLAHAEISLKCALVNLRKVDTFAAETDDIAESIQKYHHDIYIGKDAVIVDDSMIQAINNLSNNKTNSGVTECIDAIGDILRRFYQEIGVRYSKDKKERMVEAEVQNDDQMLLLNVDDMLKQRQDAAKEMTRLNKLWGYDNPEVSVELSSEFKSIAIGSQKGDVEDED